MIIMIIEETKLGKMSNYQKSTLFLPLLLLALLITLPQHTDAQAKKEWVIVIDPGHGGTDPGAVSGTVKEKDITLAVALQLGKLLSGVENTKVVYTREKDETVELYKRPKKANDSKADLFISIHCNSVESSKPYGAETWVMGLHRSKANLEVAKTENAVILLEADYQNRYDGFDPNSPEAEIIFSLYQNAYLDQSVEFASLVQKELRTVAQRFDRGVKQAGFLVLYKTNMPGILVEAGFISNENERKYLTTDAGQKAIAASIYNAVLNYREKVDGVKPKIKPSATTEEKTVETKPAEPKSLETIPGPGNKSTENKNDEPGTGSLIEPYTANHTKGSTPAGNHNKSAESEAGLIKTDKKPDTVPKPQPVSVNPPETYFAVQFLTSSKERKPNDPAFAGIKDVHVYQQDGNFKYVAGYFLSLDQAAKLKNEMTSGAYKDAFVVAFHKGKRVTTAEAQQLLKK
jgi:N-acetylmuramoyl-L-alanine amidase